MTKQIEEQEREGQYPLSLAETLSLAKKVSWHYHKVPPGFAGGGFCGQIENANVLLSGNYIEITASFRSVGDYCQENKCLAEYQDKSFREIWDRLIDREKQDVERQKKSLLNKLKTMAK
ncbi:MAG: hypothetical protein WC781_01090 [Candidatus Pacearchaeota archaeon]|jgi:hypothetical protein